MLYDYLDAIEQFLDKGGIVLYAILIHTLILWFYLSERFIYISMDSKKLLELLKGEFSSCQNEHTWRGVKVREQIINHYRAALKNNLPIIKTLLVIAPFLGLLGTVVGMIEIFDVMSATGSNDAKSMASGVARATIPTMAGMVVSITGVFVVSRYENMMNSRVELLREVL